MSDRREPARPPGAAFLPGAAAREERGRAASADPRLFLLPRGILAGALLLSMLAAPSAARTSSLPPEAVAPGDAGLATPAAPCSSFHWGRAEPALAYELVVYRADDRDVWDGSISDEPAAIQPALFERIDGTAFSWAPGADRCLTAGATYGWSLRAILEGGPTDWASPLFFRVDEAPAGRELELALEVLRRHVESIERIPRHRSRSDLTPPAALTPTAISDALREIREPRGGILEPPGPPEYSGGGPASLRSSGEVRTVDAGGQPRVWGRGRQGTKVWGLDAVTFCSSNGVRFGLSDGMTEWGAAENVCPAGTWVCRATEIAAALPCNTSRPDGTSEAYDGIECDGNTTIDRAASDHLGWLADQAGQIRGALRAEGGSSIDKSTCATLPVWCCFE